MARITVEDCLEHVDNRFELVLLASKRARQLANGSQTFLEQPDEDEKPTVMALREIAAAKVDKEAVEHIDEQERSRREREALEWAAAEFNDDEKSNDD